MKEINIDELDMCGWRR